MSHLRGLARHQLPALGVLIGVIFILCVGGIGARAAQSGDDTGVAIAEWVEGDRAAQTGWRICFPSIDAASLLPFDMPSVSGDVEEQPDDPFDDHPCATGSSSSIAWLLLDIRPPVANADRGCHERVPVGPPR